MFSPRVCSRQVEKEKPNVSRTRVLAQSPATRATPVSAKSWVVSSTSIDMVIGPPMIATPIAAIPMSAAVAAGRAAANPRSGDSTPAEQLADQRADEQRSEEEAAAKAEAERDGRRGDLDAEDDREEPQRHLGAKIEVKRAMAGR